MFGVSNTYSPAIWMSRVMILVRLMVKRNPVNSPSWGEGMFIMAYPKVIPLFYMGFLYIPGGCLGFLPSTDRIKLLNTWHLAKLTIKRNIFSGKNPHEDMWSGTLETDGVQKPSGFLYNADPVIHSGWVCWLWGVSALGIFGVVQIHSDFCRYGPKISNVWRKILKDYIGKEVDEITWMGLHV